MIDLQLLDCRRQHATQANLLAATAATTNISEVSAFIRPLSSRGLSLDSVVNRPQSSKLIQLLGFSVHIYMDVMAESP
jgi:hypothetical protein